VEVPNPPWHREPSRASKPQLSQELVVKTALEILAEEGIEAVSMRRISRALDTGPTSLYAHISNKDELDELMFDQVLAEVPLPEPDAERWTIQLKELLRGHLQAMLTYPGIAKVAWSTTVPVGPNVLQHGETALTLLRAGGLSLKQAAYAADALSQYTRAFATRAAPCHRVKSTKPTWHGAASRCGIMNSLPPDTFPKPAPGRRVLQRRNGERTLPIRARHVPGRPREPPRAELNDQPAHHAVGEQPATIGEHSASKIVQSGLLQQSLVRRGSRLTHAVGVKRVQ
jgi:AcrR family transcriptional regulator